MQDIERVLRQIDWRQGDIVAIHCNSVLIAASIDKKPEYSDNSIVCLISQDCDIVLNTDKEPYIELLKGEILEKKSEQYSNLKSPRILDIRIDDRIVRFSIHDRFRVSKNAFFSVEKHPSFHFNNSGKDILRRWISRRYVRAAFPDAFNLRLQKNDAFQRLLKSDLARAISGVWIDVPDNELPDNSTYNVRIIVGIQDDLDREILSELEQAFMKAFSTCTDIIITDIQFSTYDDITLRHLLAFRRLDRDSLTLHGDENTALLPIEADMH